MTLRATWRRGLAGLLLVLWGLSLALPVAIMGPRPGNIYPGWGILMIGWLGPLVGQFGWLANPAFFLGLVALVWPPRNPVLSYGAAIGLAALTLDALTWREIYGDDGPARVQAFGTGYYLWFAVMGAAIAALVAPEFIRRARRGEP